MSFASGFFNSVDHDRLYDATDISRLFDGLIRDGIFASIGDCLVVKQSNQMNVTVGTGRAWFNHTWSYNDALYPVTIPPSEILMDRIDAIVLEINSVEAVRANSIKLIKGTPASTPTKPALTNTKEVHQYPLAYVTVGKEVTSIRQADIENCVGTSACPFVTGILEVISIEQLIPQWKDILNRFVEENTANFNTWMNGEKQEYQDWLAAAKKEITDWEATSKSDYQKWYDSIKNGYDQWFATIKAAYDANWSTFQQWEKASQTEFDKWFENMKNKLEGDLGAKLTLETEKLGKEKVSLIESTKTDLEGTVEAPLMIGKATRNLLHYPYVKSSGSVSHGVTMTYTEEGTVSFDGTLSDGASQPGFILHNHPEKLFNDAINTLYSKYDTTIPGVLYAFFQIFKSDTNAWVTNVETLSKNDYDWTKYYCQYVVQYHKTSGDVHGTVSNIRIVTDADDPFVPYSGYDIKTIGKNLIPYPYYRGSEHTSNGVTFTVDSKGIIHASGTATNTASYAVFANGIVPCLTVGKKYAITLTVKNGTASVFLANTKDNKNTDIAAIRQLSVGTKSTTFTFTRIDGATDRIGIYIANGTTVTDCQIQVQLEEGETATDIEQYQSSTTKITQATEFPNFDLKSFDGVTHIISPSNVQSFHADAPNGKYLLESIKKSAESGGISYGPTRPTNPKSGDLWVDADHSDVLMVYDGEQWGYISSGTYTGAFPSSPYNGQLCYDPSTKMMNVYIVYGGAHGGPGWYPVGSDDPGGYHYGASAPANTKLLWIDTSGVARFYNGSAWVPLAATWG